MPLLHFGVHRRTEHAMCYLNHHTRECVHAGYCFVFNQVVHIEPGFRLLKNIPTLPAYIYLQFWIMHGCLSFLQLFFSFERVFLSKGFCAFGYDRYAHTNDESTVSFFYFILNTK